MMKELWKKEENGMEFLVPDTAGGSNSLFTPGGTGG